VGGERIIDRVARSLRIVGDRLLVVSNDPSAAGWLVDAEVVGDVLPGRASLIGIHAALVHAGTDVVVVAWDMPFVSAGLLGALQHRLTGSIGAVIPSGPHGPEPACAAYSMLALPHIERRVNARELKLADLVDAIPDVDRMPASEVARFGDPDVLFLNVNHPGDLSRAEAIASAL
jgi:molybdopterin-guanine dinucleotide biosynthesis protein A